VHPTTPDPARPFAAYTTPDSGSPLAANAAPNSAANSGLPGAQSILAGLNPPQREAVEHTEGPVLVIAGAGSGKTNVLTRRIAYLIMQRRVPPWAILAITFTNKAAREMQDRIGRLIGPMAMDVWAMTFHSMCVRILRRAGDHIGIERNFTILDGSDQLTVVKRIMERLNIDAKRYDPRAVLHTISEAKNDLLTAAKYVDTAADPFRKIVGQVYVEYERRLKANQSLDFDDLIFKTVQLFQQAPEVLKEYQTRFQYIHVDEYQDTNHAQYQLVSLLAERRKNLCVVGDSDQSIYAWRGADIRNILEFERDYRDAVVIRLEQNYRSTKTILEIANGVIQNNHQRREKVLWTENIAGDKAKLYRATDERAEARYIVNNVQVLHQAGVAHHDFGILYRTNAQSRAIEEAFLQAGVPYRVFGGLKFYERKEIKDVLSFLRLILNPADDVSLRRVINVPKRGIGDTSLARLDALAVEYGTSMYGVLAQADQAGIRGKTQRAIAEFAAVLDQLIQMRPFLNVTELTEQIIEKSGYREALRLENTLEAEGRLENLNEFLTVTGEFDARWSPTAGNSEADGSEFDAAGDAEEDVLQAFLTEVALVADTDLNGGSPEPNSDETDSVVLMTLHSAKGLEFPVVFLPGMEEGLFPHNRSLESESEMEEERRLCYVGVTRARQKLYLTTCSSRTIFGKFRQAVPSRFLAEMPQDFLEPDAPARRVGWVPRADSSGRGVFGQAKSFAAGQSAGGRAAGGTESTNGTPAFGTDDAAVDVPYRAGDKVEHRKWGPGTVVAAKGAGEDMELTIAFPAPVGVKRLVARFAPIRMLEGVEPSDGANQRD